MVSKPLFLAALSLFSRGAAGAGPFDVTADHVAWDDTTYTLTSRRPYPGSYQAWLPQSNGYIGLAQGSLGPFLEASRSNESTGWPLFGSPRLTFATVTGFWDDELDGESVVAGIPHFTDLLVGACGSTLNGTADVSEISDFKSTLSFSTGIATWDYVWSPSACPENVALRISYEAFLSLDERQIGAVKLSVSSNSSVEILITDILDGHSADRTLDAEPRFFPPKRAILTSVKPIGVDDITAYIYSTVRGDLPQYQKGLSSDPDTKSISQSYSVRLDPAVKAGTASFVKYVGVVSTEHSSDAKALVIKAVDRAATTGWEVLRSAHTAQVSLLMHNDFLADFRDPATGALPEDSDVRSLQITAITSAYYLYTSLMPHDNSNAALFDLELGCAFWTFLLQYLLPYVRAPWYQFTEPQNDDTNTNTNVGSDPLNDKEPRFFSGGTSPAFPFMTGHGELLQVMTAGFLGVRTTDVNLVLNPALPPQLAHFKAPLQFHNGAVVECRMNRTHTTITRRDASKFDGIVPDQYGDGVMPIIVGRSADDPDGYKVHLKIGETAVIPNRQYSNELTTPGNILQCKSSSSPDEHIPGQFPQAATDGSPGTSWQPESDSAASLLVDLSSTGDQPAAELERVLLDFAKRPPKNIRVLLSNDSSFADPPGQQQQQQPLGQWIPVAVSRPWVAASPVVQNAGNSTTVELPRGVWSGRYARLDVEGCWAEDGAGATVAEFAIVSRGRDAGRAVEPGEVGHDEL
ncbi:hypothetical protein INS49_013476 [Diaporthe citri]|uniref:uncharacterized protein n=1 Tax=Diaporthe citri TaxID=83186 RepID=UPI001C7FFCEC|nr:uncharacterized protein INS49_013476 [Diaporthe citri]KAG6357599.1 hypothetical protein INS49_013476 [Diaporthe citri]